MKKRINPLSAVVSAIVVVLTLSASASAQQTTGDILGTVSDVSGAAVPGATVKVENLDTHAVRTVQTGTRGEYVVNLLQPAHYSVSVEAPGFKIEAAPSLQLSAGDRTRFDASLQPGAATETVNVTAEATALQSDSSVLSNTIVAKAVQDLPLNGRNFVQLVQLQPGVNEGPPDGLNTGGKLDDHRQTASFSVNGQSDALNNQMIDGVDNNERQVGTIGVRPSVEAIGEMRVQTGNYTAEVGRTGGGIINIITKSGTNSLHGTVFEYFRNDVLNAFPFAFGASLPKAELRQNQFGASIGGPVRRDKTFFFGDYEGFRLIAGDTPSRNTTPTLYEEQHIGDFSDIGGPVIPAASLDKAAAAYFTLYPAPNSGATTYVGAGKNIQNSDIFDVRIDHQINASNQTFARFNYNKVFTQDNGPLPSRQLGATGIYLTPGLGSSAPQLEYQGLLNYVHTFSPRLLGEFKAAYTRIDNSSIGNTDGTNANQVLGQPNVNYPASACTGLALIVPIGIAGPNASSLGSGCVFNPDKNQNNVFQYTGSLIYTRGNHNIKTGLTYIDRQLKQTQNPFGQGLWLFFNLETFLQGQVFQVQRSLVLGIPHLKTFEPSAYIQDDWHVARSLTLNLGLRYDIYSPFSETANRISTFSPYTGQLLVANQNGVNQFAGIGLKFHDVAPRFGFAYSPKADFVIRGGYGIGFVPMNSTATGTLRNPPFVSAATYNGISFQGGLPVPTPSTLDQPGAAVPYAEDPKWQDSYIQQFNLTVQKELGGNVVTMSYVGLLGRHLDQYVPDRNAPPPNAQAQGSPSYQALRPFYAQHPNLTTVGYSSSTGASNYNSYQVSVERRLRHGLTSNFNYTLAHNLDNSTGLSEEGAGGYGAIPSRISSIEYGNSVLDLRNRFAATANYQIPGGTNSKSRLVRESLSGWQLNLIDVWSSGPAFTATNGTTVSNTVSGGSDRPDQIGNPRVSHSTITQFFNTAAFQAQPAGTFGAPVGSAPGTIGSLYEHRNQLHGPHYRHIDLSLLKTFSLSDRFNLEFRAETFNLTNTSNFANPDAVLTDANYGQITSTLYSYAPRQIQFALKLHF